jgi:hypothetical protein
VGADVDNHTSSSSSNCDDHERSRRHVNRIGSTPCLEHHNVDKTKRTIDTFGSNNNVESVELSASRRTDDHRPQRGLDKSSQDRSEATELTHPEAGNPDIKTPSVPSNRARTSPRDKVSDRALLDSRLAGRGSRSHENKRHSSDVEERSTTPYARSERRSAGSGRVLQSGTSKRDRNDSAAVLHCVEIATSRPFVQIKHDSSCDPSAEESERQVERPLHPTRSSDATRLLWSLDRRDTDFSGSSGCPVDEAVYRAKSGTEVFSSSASSAVDALLANASMAVSRSTRFDSNLRDLIMHEFGCEAGSRVVRRWNRGWSEECGEVISEEEIEDLIRRFPTTQSSCTSTSTTTTTCWSSDTVQLLVLPEGLCIYFVQR